LKKQFIFCEVKHLSNKNKKIKRDFVRSGERVRNKDIYVILIIVLINLKLSIDVSRTLLIQKIINLITFYLG